MVGEVTFFLWHTLHLPISAEADGVDRKREGEVLEGAYCYHSHGSLTCSTSHLTVTQAFIAFSNASDNACKDITLCAVSSEFSIFREC